MDLEDRKKKILTAAIRDSTMKICSSWDMMG
jgi:hypothetical protein